MTVRIVNTASGSIPSGVDQAQLHGILISQTLPADVTVILGDGFNPITPADTVGLLVSGHMVVSWADWPWYQTPLPPAQTNGFYQVMAQAWQEPAQAAIGLNPYDHLLYGAFDFNPKDYAWAGIVSYPYARAFITGTAQSNHYVPFHSAPTSAAFPNFQTFYSTSEVFGFSGIAASCKGGGMFVWANAHVGGFDLADFIGNQVIPTWKSLTVSHVSPSPTSTPRTYTVQPGDTLSKIAGKFGISLAQLESYNRTNIPNPNYIVPGQIVNLGPVSSGGQPIPHFRSATTTTVTPSPATTATASHPSTATTATASAVGADLLVAGLVVGGAYLLMKSS